LYALGQPRTVQVHSITVSAVKLVWRMLFGRTGPYCSVDSSSSKSSMSIISLYASFARHLAEQPFVTLPTYIAR